jgi:hypothetical protein
VFAGNWTSSGYKLPRLLKCLKQDLGSAVGRSSGRFSSSSCALCSPTKPYSALAALFARLGPPSVSSAPYRGTFDTHL